MVTSGRKTASTTVATANIPGASRRALASQGSLLGAPPPGRNIAISQGTGPQAGRNRYPN